MSSVATIIRSINRIAFRTLDVLLGYLLKPLGVGHYLEFERNRPWSIERHVGQLLIWFGVGELFLDWKRAEHRQRTN